MESRPYVHSITQKRGQELSTASSMIPKEDEAVHTGTVSYLVEDLHKRVDGRISHAWGEPCAYGGSCTPPLVCTVVFISVLRAILNETHKMSTVHPSTARAPTPLQSSPASLSRLGLLGRI